jgi:hypothetical protein
MAMFAVRLLAAKTASSRKRGSESGEVENKGARGACVWFCGKQPGRLNLKIHPCFCVLHISVVFRGAPKGIGYFAKELKKPEFVLPVLAFHAQPFIVSHFENLFSGPKHRCDPPHSGWLRAATALPAKAAFKRQIRRSHDERGYPAGDFRHHHGHRAGRGFKRPEG